VRDTRESRLLLVLLIAVAFALITVDIRGGDASPLNGPRNVAASVLGPVETGVSGLVNPVADTVHSVTDAGAQHNRISALEQQNLQLKQQLSSSDLAHGQSTELSRMLGAAGAGQYTVKAAQVVAIGAAQGFSWTVTIDIGSNDGIKRDMTVINGDGLVGRITTVGPSTSTVLLADDASAVVGARLAGSNQIGSVAGTGKSLSGPTTLKLTLFAANAVLQSGQDLVTFGSVHDTPYVPGVPIGQVTRVQGNAGALTKTALVKPYVDFTSLGVVGVVVGGPAKDPRDSVLPTGPKPAPTVTVTVTPSAGCGTAASDPSAKSAAV